MKRVVIIVALLAALAACIYFMLPSSESQSQKPAASNAVSDNSSQEANTEAAEQNDGEPASDNSQAENDDPRRTPPPERMKVTRPHLDLNEMTPEERKIAGIENLIIDYLLGKAGIDNVKEAATGLREISENISNAGGAYNRAGYSFALYYEFCREELEKAGIKCEPLDNIEDPISYSYFFHRYPDEKGRLFAVQCIYTQQDRKLQDIEGSPYMVLSKVCGKNFSDNRDKLYLKMLNDLGLKEGMSVADIGGGIGRLTWLEKQIVGPKGHAYLAEIDYSCEDFLDYIREYQPAFKELGEVEFVKANLDDPMLPGKMDCITFSEVHVLRDDDWKNWGHDYMILLREKYLKPGGKVAFYEGNLDSDMMIKGAGTEERMQIATERLTSAGYKNITFSSVPYYRHFRTVIAEI